MSPSTIVMARYCCVWVARRLLGLLKDGCTIGTDVWLPRDHFARPFIPREGVPSPSSVTMFIHFLPRTKRHYLRTLAAAPPFFLPSPIHHLATSQRCLSAFGPLFRILRASGRVLLRMSFPLSGLFFLFFDCIFPPPSDFCFKCRGSLG